jgi:hypothetical protein
MSRSGYTDDYDDQWSLIRYRGAVTSALRGKRGQAFLRELIAALDALPEKILIAFELQAEGSFCAIGAVGAMRGVDMSKLDIEDARQIANTFGIADAMVREIEWMNDEAAPYNETPAARWQRMRDWAERNLIEWIDEEEVR